MKKIIINHKRLALLITLFCLIGSFTFYKYCYAAGPQINDMKGKIGIKTLYLVPKAAPVSCYEACIAGEVRITTSYIYFCYANNNWVRAQLVSW